MLKGRRWVSGRRGWVCGGQDEENEISEWREGWREELCGGNDGGRSKYVENRMERR